jgi:hypothetical protein
MLDLSKITQIDFEELKSIALKAEEKSPLNRDNYIFDLKSSSVSKVYSFAFRFLFNIHSMIEEGDLKTAIKVELDKNQEIYDNIRRLDEGIAKNNLFTKLREKKLFYWTSKSEVAEMIDLMGALLEKTQLLSMSKFKGILLEGKSKEEFARVQKEFTSI